MSHTSNHGPEPPPCDHCSEIDRRNAALLEALKAVQPALLAAILFIEGGFPENRRGNLLRTELTSYRLRERKARAAIAAAEETA